MSTFLRSPFSGAALALLVLTVLCVAVIEVAGADEDAPLQLGSEHLGMTSEGIQEAKEQAAIERSIEAEIEKSEWTDEDLGDDFACECECPEVADAAAAPAAGVETHAAGVSDYESCIEVAIRGGNGFSAASSVCQTLYPELVEPLATATEPELVEPLATATDPELVEPLTPPSDPEPRADAGDLSAQPTTY